MCGLVGVAGNLSFKEEKAFRTLLILDTIRGEDSTGVAFVTKGGAVTVCKEVGNPFNLFDTNKYINAQKRSNMVAMGHNRFATSGLVIKKNAHPFDFDTLVGCHNGTLKNKSRLANSQDFNVDSENLYHHIEKHGLKNAIEILDGAWALSWYDKLNSTLNFLRNKERPLSFAETQDGTCMFWASEAWMIKIAASRADVKIKDPVELPEDIHYEFEFQDNNKNILKPKARRMESKLQNFPVSNYSGKWNQASHSNTATVAQNTNNVVPIKGDLSGGIDPKKALLVQQKTLLELSQNALSSGFSEEVVNSYVGRKSVSLHISCQGKDSFGATYLNLIDPQRPLFPIRMYINKDRRFENAQGRLVLADIGSYNTTTSKIPFFKVSIHNCVLVDERGPSEDTTLKYDNGKGQLLTKKEWEKKFQFCTLCFESLDAADHGNRLILDSGHWQCVCPECVATKSEEISDRKPKNVY